MRRDKPIIRLIDVNDAENWILLLKQLLKETNTMLFTNNDRDFNITRCQENIKKIRDENKSEILVLENKVGQLVGYLLGEVYDMEKQSHIMSIKCGILKKYQMGYGRKLVEKMIEIAKLRGIKRFEASVITSNKVSFNACVKIGFQPEGVKKCAIKLSNDHYEDEHILGMLI